LAGAVKLGLLAGSGKFPLLIAEEAKRRDVTVVALGIKGVTDPSLESLVGPVVYFKLGQLDKPIKTLKDAGVSEAVMAGKVQHVSLFGGILPDWRAAKMLAGLADRRTDTILKSVAAEFEKDGIRLLSSATYLSHLLAVEGAMTSRKLSKAQTADVALGWKAAKSVAGFDIGQTVVVCEGAVVAVEAMEGTDACIRRAAELARRQGQRPELTVVKVSKPKQDFRFDLPVIGLDSLPVFKESGVTALAVESGSTLIFDKPEFLKKADAQGLAVFGLKESAP
jgi:DUF1009 family protein